jgi:16S rRNA (cytosine967-C5)-methyltransferase
MRVLDACAAPGGKTAHLLERAGVRLTALDHDPARLEKVGDNLRRLDLQADCRCGDAAAPEGWWDGQPFQRILADVPCSASGVVRRHPDIKWLRRPADIMVFAGQQEHILNVLWRLLAPGGKLLYVTCSIFSEENQQQIKSFLNTHSDARHLPLPEHPDVKMNQGQLIPDDRHDGFFYALLEKS